jgi:hypothetical protein
MPGSEHCARASFGEKEEEVWYPVLLEHSVMPGATLERTPATAPKRDPDRNVPVTALSCVRRNDWASGRIEDRADRGEQV